MKYTDFPQKTFIVLTILYVAFFLSSFQAHADTNIKIGVRAHSGHGIAMKKWSGTAQYLNHEIQGYNFIIQPIVEFNDMKQAIKLNKIDFVLTNPAAYIELEKEYGVSRIATLINRRGKDTTSEFGAIIFTHAKRFDINQLSDLKGKSYMGVHPQAFGGWWMALGELKNHHINPFQYCKKVSFAGTQESVVFSVLNGQVDAGTVRTGIIERLARKGDIDLNDIKILNKWQDDFSLAHSTELYPEWPIAGTAQVSSILSEKIAQALFEMKPENMAAITGGYTGWTAPLSYKKIHDLLKYLKVGAYTEYGDFTFIQVAKRYWQEITVLLILFLISISFAGYKNHANRVLITTKHRLETEVSQRKTAERKAMKSRDEADKANQAKSEFLSSMSHELRTPLNAILGFGQLLDMDANKFNETQQSNIKEILDGGRHLLNLIDEILDLNKIESGHLEISMEEVSVDDVLRQCLPLIQTQANERHIELVDHLSNQGHIVYADLKRLKQVLVNLLSNAVKYNQTHGRITLDSEVIDKKRLRIQIIDTGEGLTEKDITKLFVPFERLKNKHKVEGTGIGLTISKNIVELMGGNIGVDSEPGNGSTFWVELSRATIDKPQK